MTKPINLSRFGTKFTKKSGVLQLMDDIDSVTNDPDVIMLGGGNPGRIPSVLARYRDCLEAVSQDPEKFATIFGNYTKPQGDQRFIKALVSLLNNEFGWGITSQNIALCNGSQNAFFNLFNALAGESADIPGLNRTIKLPLTPEYIGYDELSIAGEMFDAEKPLIKHLDSRQFKYKVDFNHLKLDQHTAALCVSRPTNPTGNVLTDNEIKQLDTLATKHNIPLIIDNAYGAPFPHIIHADVDPYWHDNMIMCLSLSKLGLPAVRTGIIIARPEVTQLISAMNAVTNLAPSSIGPGLLTPLVESGEILRLSQNHIRPFYKNRADKAYAKLDSVLGTLPVHIHKPEGSIFLWLWADNLPITVQTLYERLKKRKVIIVPGHHFFPGLKQEWAHRHQCFRMAYAQDEDKLMRGIEIINEELQRAYQEG